MFFNSRISIQSWRVNGQESMRCDFVLQLLSPPFVKYTHPTTLQLLLIAFKKNKRKQTTRVIDVNVKQMSRKWIRLKFRELQKNCIVILIENYSKLFENSWLLWRYILYLVLLQFPWATNYPIFLNSTCIISVCYYFKLI